MNNQFLILKILSGLSRTLGTISKVIPLYRDISPGVKKAYNLLNNYSLKRNNNYNINRNVGRSEVEPIKKPAKTDGNPVFFK